MDLTSDRASFCADAVLATEFVHHAYSLTGVYVRHIHMAVETPYQRLASCVGFQWDPGNETKNWEKHAVLEGECEQVFFNRPLIVKADAGHSQSEQRYFALGRTDESRLMFVVFTIRGDMVRVISARDMTQAERRRYPL